MVTRRTLLWSGLTLAGGLALGIGLPHGLSLATRLRNARPLGTPGWIEIDRNNEISIYSTLTEMGQGIWTTLAQIVGEELDADWNQLAVRMAPTWKAFNDPIGFYTGSSTSTTRLFQHMRQVGAAARIMLRDAAAGRWGVAAEECLTRAGSVLHEASGRSLPYGALIDTAAQQRVPSQPELKPRGSWRLMGKALPRLDGNAIVTGRVRYGMDLELPDMVVAAITQSPLEGVGLQSYDRDAILSQPGVVQIIELDDALAVVAKNYWQAQQGLRHGRVQWRSTDLSTDGLRQKLLASVARSSKSEDSNGWVDAIYQAPLLTHAQLEPLNATARVTRLSAELWVPTQLQGVMQRQVAKALGLWTEAVTLHTPPVGGGFGRRLRYEYGVTAALVARELDRPVKVIWSREEDTAQGRFRPMCAAHLTARLGSRGELLEWNATMAALGTDRRTWGVEKLPYGAVQERVEFTGIPSPIRTGPWRSVDASQNIFFRESFIDECAHRVSADPLEYRLRLLPDPRAQRVLNKLAEVAHWQASRDAGRHLGIAFSEGLGSLAALAAEVGPKPTDAANPGAWQVRRLWAVVDCGIAINPNMIEAQMQGGILFGLSAALFEEISFKAGRIEQQGFDTYRILRMSESPQIEIHILESEAANIGGIGEVGVPLVAPAVANALFSATATRVRQLPLTKSGLLY